MPWKTLIKNFFRTHTSLCIGSMHTKIPLILFGKKNYICKNFNPKKYIRFHHKILFKKLPQNI